MDPPHRQLQENHVTVSPATLYLYGLMYTIALDGTDAQFAELASTVGPDIGHALELLKDMESDMCAVDLSRLIRVCFVFHAECL